MTKFVLCRKKTNDIGEPTQFCAKPITKANALDWCAEHFSRTPIWPTVEEVR